jgi:uncharacterized protein YbaA (DUF1428 family)
MAYVYGFLAPVPKREKENYISYSAKAWALFQEYGAIGMQECWEEAVTDGETASFPKAVERQPGEAVVFSWLFWPDRETAEACMASFQTDDRWKVVMGAPFDGERMMFGGFETIFSAQA